MARPTAINPQLRSRIIMLYEPPYAMSMGAIAKTLSLTKNQVVGVLHRAAKQGDVTLRREQGAGPIVRADGSTRMFTPRPVAERRRRPNTPAVAPAAAAAPAGPPEGDEAVAPPREQLEGARGARVPSPPLPALTVFRPLRPRQCCWPMWGTGKPTHVYCEATAEEGKPYCPEHRLMSLDLKRMAAIAAWRANRRETQRAA